MKKGLFFPPLLFMTLLSLKVTAQIVSVNPDTVEQGQLLDIEVTAQNIDFTQGTSVIWLKNGSYEITKTASQVISSTKMAFNLSTSHPTGLYSITVWNTGTNTTYSKADGLLIKPDLSLPVIDSISTASARQGETVKITCYGSNTNFSKTSVSNSFYLSKSWGQILPASINVVDSGTLEGVFQLSYGYETGHYQVKVHNAYDGELVLIDGFELIAGDNPPEILSINPDTIVQGELLSVEITAGNIDFTQGSNVITLSQGTVFVRQLQPSSTSPTSLTADVLLNIDHPEGLYDVSIWNTAADVTMTMAGGIFVKPDLSAASLSQVSPLDAEQGETITMTLQGNNTNFISSGANNEVWLIGADEGIAATGVNAEDSETLTAEFSFTYGHPSGIYSVNLRNSYDGTITFEDPFTLNMGPLQPAITDVLPDTLIQGASLDVEVTAENLDFTQGTNVVHLLKDDFSISMNSAVAINPNKLIVNFSLPVDCPLGAYKLSIWNTAFDITLIANQTLIKEDAVYLKSATAIDGRSVRPDVLFFPNPAGNNLNLKQRFDRVQLVDATGRLVLEGRQVDYLDISEIPEGLYLVRLIQNKDTYLNKLVIKR
ncbi:MAG: T9SS type A sorting domain-containing protein [Bacteroidales bacterium]